MDNAALNHKTGFAMANLYVHSTKHSVQSILLEKAAGKLYSYINLIEMQNSGKGHFLISFFF